MRKGSCNALNFDKAERKKKGGSIKKRKMAIAKKAKENGFFFFRKKRYCSCLGDFSIHQKEGFKKGSRWREREKTPLVETESAQETNHRVTKTLRKGNL